MQPMLYSFPAVVTCDSCVKADMELPVLAVITPLNAAHMYLEKLLLNNPAVAYPLLN